MTKTARDIVNQLLGHDDNDGYHDDCKKEAHQALKELEAIISEQVIGIKTATYRPDSFLSDYAESAIRIAIDDAIRYRPGQLSPSDKDWLQSTVEKILKGAMQHKHDNSLRDKQRQALHTALYGEEAEL
jgi:hypothetical protein